MRPKPMQYMQERNGLTACRMALLSSAAHGFSASLSGLHACKAIFTLSSCASSENLANLLRAIVRYAAALPVACPAYLATRGRSLGPAAVGEFAEVWCSKHRDRDQAGFLGYLRQPSPGQR